MTSNYRFEMDQKDIVRSLITSISSFIQDKLIDKDQRTQHKEQCAERLASDNRTPDKATEVRYSDQAVLANLDWGIDALEEAINTSNTETKMARLDYAEKMLQVCAMLNSSQKTAGVPNSYLSAWAHLNLSYLWKLRNNTHNAVLHILEMFTVDPFFSRIDFAPELWKSIFLPNMGSIFGWYSEERRRIVMDVIPDTTDMSFTVDFDNYFDESLILSVRPEQAQRIQELERLYGQSLDDNTKLYAKYYKDCMSYDSATSKKAMPMLPIAEPPMSPLHEFSSRSVPDYVKFGPILPKSAGFSPVLVAHNVPSHNQEEILESEESSEVLDAYISSKDRSPKAVSNASPRSVKDDDTRSILSNRSIRLKDVEINTSRQMVKFGSRLSPDTVSPMDSPKTPSTRTSSPRVFTRSPRKAPTSMLRLLSTRALGSISSPSQSVSPHSCGDDGIQSYACSPSSDILTPQSRPPKDFVCPITGQIFNDPVTLETGQTYETKAIQEWMNRGNTTCPITRQPLSAASLPKTNYVLKRLITSWKEQHPDLAQEFSFSCTETPQSYLNQRSTSNETEYKPPQRFLRASVALSSSPTSVISQASVETVINALKPYILCLCSSEDLQECEAAVLTIAKILGEDLNVHLGVHPYLSSPTIVNGFVEILSASLNKDVLRTTIYILSKLISADDRVGDLLASIDSDFYCLAGLLKKGLPEACVLVYLLRPSYSNLSSHNLTTSLISIISNKNEDHNGFQYVVSPKDAAIALLEEVIVGGDEDDGSCNARNVVSEDGIHALLSCLNRVDARQSIVSILLCCIRTDVSCKETVANRIELSPVLELFHGGNDSVRGMCIEFLLELVQLSRRTLANQILQIIKEDGTFSTMHTLLVYLQNAPMEQKPAIATLLLQLDLLVAPQKMSIYREEAIEALLEAIQRKEFPSSQIMALNALSSLSGHSSDARKPNMESRLLKVAGFDQNCSSMRRTEEMENNETKVIQTKEEARAARTWEKRMAFVLCNHEKGVIFQALEECFKSNSIEIAKSCLVVATWLVYMLYSSPDCGIRGIARKSLLDKFINVLQSSKNLEEKILASLALRGFVSEPGGITEVEVYAKSIWKTLRKLRRSCTVVHDIMKALMNLPSIDSAELWSCAEGPEVDVSVNGEILSMVHIRNRLISSHSDGSIKVWDTGKRAPRLIQETREHSKAVTCLSVPPSCDKLYSGSLDKSIRVWSIKQDGIHCVQVHDVKEPVLVLTANASVACYSSQGSGVKVYNWSSVPKHINFNKQVKCVALEGDKLYCGCSGYSIQEVDLRTNTSSTFYSGAKKLLGKQTIYSVEIHNGFLIAGGSSVDGIAGKVFELSSKAVIGTLTTGLDIQQTTVNNDFIFTATKSDIIEVWLRDRVTKIAYMKTGNGGNARVTSIASDVDGQKFFAATSEGKLKVWSLE